MSQKKGNLHVIDQIYNQVPAFTDVFSEDSFYVFVVFFVLCTLLVAFILSRFITLKPVEWKIWKEKNVQSIFNHKIVNALWTMRMCP